MTRKPNANPPLAGEAGFAHEICEPAIRVWGPSYVAGLAFCSCGQPFTAVSHSAILVRRYIGRKARKHLQRVENSRERQA